LSAELLVLLDNLTRGRALFGVGPGELVTDALMFGVAPTRTRPMMDESLGVILRLFTETEPITVESDWFTLRDAVLQVRPSTQPHMPIGVASRQSPSGPALAGKYGAGLLSVVRHAALHGRAGRRPGGASARRGRTWPDAAGDARGDRQSLRVA
jgi:limonene 1,2-monooxygenase